MTKFLRFLVQVPGGGSATLKRRYSTDPGISAGKTRAAAFFSPAGGV
jgi:hypothetical protein